MYRIDNATAVTPIPAPAAVGPNPNYYFTKGNPGLSIPATVVDDDWANAVQEELCNAITGFGVALDKTKRDQLSTILLGTTGFFRRRLSANTNFYVRTDGNDSNDGLTNTAGGAFLTIQGACNALQKRWDANQFTPTVNIGAGTFAGWTMTGRMLGQLGIIIFNGAGGTTIINTSIIGSSGAAFRYQNMTVGTVSGPCAISSSGSSIGQGAGVILTGCENVQTVGLLQTALGGSLQVEQSFTIANPGTIPSVFHAESAGLSFGNSITITHTGTCTISAAYAYSYFGGIITVPSITFVGTVTGKRYDANFNSLIYVSGAGASYFPGNSAGTVANGGTYA